MQMRGFLYNYMNFQLWFVKSFTSQRFDSIKPTLMKGVQYTMYHEVTIFVVLTFDRKIYFNDTINNDTINEKQLHVRFCHLSSNPMTSLFLKKKNKVNKLDD